MAMLARAQYTPYGELRLNFPFHPHLIQALKQEIPSYCRTYDPLTKTWIITGGWQTLARELLLVCFPNACIDNPSDNRNPNPSHSIDWALAQLHLLPSAPPDLIDAAFRTLAKLHHPDAGGDSEVMRKLNGAYSVLKAGAIA